MIVAMLPSQTVENYLKTIYLAQAAMASEKELVPMGQLASSLGVVPGTATTMVKALAESGLVHYEPYMGVRLTPAGERLASLVSRRHRLIELFLVKVLGMSWAEVHDEAEQLEHAVSERLIDRIDEMLGRPSVDPHGDPIPTADLVMDERPTSSLADLSPGARATFVRISDSDPEMLRYLSERGIAPGHELELAGREPFGGPLTVLANGREHALGDQLACAMRVEPGK